MNYSEILPDVLEGKWVRFNSEDPWMEMDYGSGKFVSDGKVVTVPRPAYGFDTWEVKPGQEEIYVMAFSEECTGGVYDSFIYGSPEKEVSAISRIRYGGKPIFPVGKITKYKLIPVDE